MGAPERQPPDRLAAARAAARHGFVALVSLLERLDMAATRVGGAGPPTSEGLRFRHDPSLSFHTSDVAGVKLAPKPSASDDPFAAAEAAARDVFEVTTTFLGLSGTVSPLPLHMAEEVLGEDQDAPQKGLFLDVFHHRFLSLLYRLLVKYDYPREFLAGGTDDWSRRILALAGIGEEDGTSGLPRWRLLRLAPLLATRARTARTLMLAIEDVLADELEGAHVAVEEFVGAWVAIDAPQQAQLGRANSRLGSDLLLGQRVFDRGGKFKLTIGPLSNRAFDRFRPEGDLFPVLREVVALVNQDPLSYDLELVLALGEEPPFTLGGTRSRLGQNSWLGERRESEARMTFEVAG